MTSATDGTSYRAYFEHSPQALIVFDADGQCVDANQRACDLVGHSRAEVLDAHLTDLTVAGDRQEFFERLRETGAVETGLLLEHADGHEIEVFLDAVALEEGTFLAAVRDVSEWKGRERRIEELRERLELAVEGTNLGIWDWDLRTDEVTFNDQWAEMLGLSRADLDGELSDWKDRLHPEEEAAVLAAFDRHAAGDTEYYETEHRMRTSDGDYRWIRDVGQVIERDQDGDPIRAVGIHQDIDDRKRAERELRQAHARLRQIVDLVPDLVFVKNRAAEYILANEAFAEVFGRPVEEIIGHTDYELFEHQDPEAFHEDDLAVIESGEPLEVPEEVLITADGERRIYNTIKIPYQPIGTDQDAVLGYARDVTDLKEYERTLKSQRDSLEILNQSVRHDIRNDLQLVAAYGDLLREYVEGDAQAHLEKVLGAAENAIRITETAKTVADVVRQADRDLEPVALVPVLEDEIETARSNYAGVVTTKGPFPEVTVRADDLLDSVFRNLLQNALVHNDSEVPTVEVSVTAQEEAVAVEIADNGPGVPEEKKEAIFEEGMKGLVSEGTGLGLYIVQTLLERYDGEVSVEDNDPRGTVFTVELPLVE